MQDHPLTATFELVARAKGGDDDAFNRLFERYYDRVRRSVRVRIGPKLRQHVETSDVLQATFMKAFEIFDRFEMRDEGSLIHWLAKVAEGQIRDLVDHHGRKKRSADRESPAESGSDEEGRTRARDLPDTTRIRPDLVASTGETHRKLERALDTLPEELRMLIVLRDFEGMSWEDIAEATKRPSADAARMMHGKAKATLTIAMARPEGTAEPD